MDIVKNKTEKQKVPRGFKLNPILTDKYNDQPLFKDKIEKANHILKTVALPKI